MKVNEQKTSSQFKACSTCKLQVRRHISIHVAQSDNVSPLTHINNSFNAFPPAKPSKNQHETTKLNNLVNTSRRNIKVLINPYQI